MPVEFNTERDILDQIFGQVEDQQAGFEAEHAAPVNYGADAHWPPLGPLVGWTNRMGWDNGDLTESMPEEQLWAAVDQRRNAGEPLPAAYLLAAHIAEHGTEGNRFASDAFVEAVQRADRFIDEQQYPDDVSLEEVARDVANWTVELAVANLEERVSQAATGELAASAFTTEGRG